MPTVTLNRKTFENLVGKKLPEEKLKERISMLGTDLDKVTETEIVVELFPDRPDMLSEQGFARAFSAFIGEKTGLREYAIAKSDGTVAIDPSVKEIRPKTACCLVKGLDLNDERIREIMQIQEKLHTTFGRHRKKCAIGMYPLEHITLPITYTAKKPSDIVFRPLEAQTEMSADKILEEHPAGKAYTKLLEGLDKYPIFVDGAGKILSMPPIINSHETGRVSAETKDVFIECSGFEQHTVNIGLNMIVTALADMGGRIESMTLDYGDEKIITPNLEPSMMEVEPDYINRRLGLSLSHADIKHCLERMGYDYHDGKAYIPAYREDIMHLIDIVEDVAIAYGYENFMPQIPNVATVGLEDPFEVFKRKVTELLVGLGMLECNTYEIANEQTQREKMNCDIPVVKLANALNEDYEVVRAWVLPSLMEVLASNKHHSYPQNLFDIGTCFKKDDDSETGVAEFSRVAVVIAEEDADYTKARQYLEYVLRNFELSCEVKETEHESFTPGRVARVSVDGIDVAYVGEIAPQVLEHFDLQMPVAGFELNLTALYKKIK